MSLWGSTDNLAGAPTWLTSVESFVAGDVTTGDNSITIAGHGIRNGSKVVLTTAGNAIGLTSGVYFAKVDGDVITLHDTHTAPATFGTVKGLTSQAAGTLQIVPTGVDVAIAKATAPTANVFFVDAAEAITDTNRDKGFKTPGWYKYETYTDADSETRHKAELLCAFGGHQYDAAVGDTGVDTQSGVDEDSVVAGEKALLTIGTNPIQDGTDGTNSATVDLANEAIVLVTAATVSPAGGTISYQWQVKEHDKARFVDISAGTPYAISATDGATSELTVAAGGATAGDKYRCVVSHAEADSVTSTTVTATQE